MPSAQQQKGTEYCTSYELQYTIRSAWVEWSAQEERMLTESFASTSVDRSMTRLNSWKDSRPRPSRSHLGTVACPTCSTCCAYWRVTTRRHLHAHASCSSGSSGSSGSRLAIATAPPQGIAGLKPTGAIACVRAPSHKTRSAHLGRVTRSKRTAGHCRLARRLHMSADSHKLPGQGHN